MTNIRTFVVTGLTEAMELMDEEAQAPLQTETLELLKRASVATITTQLFALGLRNTNLAGLGPVNAQATRIVAEAFTLRSIPAREDIDVLGVFDDYDHPQRKAIEEVPPGRVLVLDSRGVTRVASIGHILVTRLAQRGAAGFVTDGSVRDGPSIASLDFPVFAAGAAATTNLAMHHVVDQQVPIACAGVPIYPGDVIVADPGGVVCVPRHLADKIAPLAAEQERLERFVLQRIESGKPLRGNYPPDASALEAYAQWAPGASTPSGGSKNEISGGQS